MHLGITPVLFMTLVSSSLASLKIHNWCSSSIYVLQVHGTCNVDPNGYGCSTAPIHVSPGTKRISLAWITGGIGGPSIKVAKDASMAKVLQFEYTRKNEGIWYDLSDLDGSGDGLVGSVFTSDNVKVTPSGPGLGQDTCQIIRCPAGQVCKKSFQSPGDNQNVHMCPLTLKEFWLDFCEPPASFNSKRDLRLHVHGARI